MGRKVGDLVEHESPPNTMWPGPRLTAVPNFTRFIQPFRHSSPTLQAGQTTVRGLVRTVLQTVA